MGVHAESVIDTQIDSFDSAFYMAICDKEEYCYDSSQVVYDDPSTTEEEEIQAGVDEYQPFFQDLNDAIVAWLNTSRNFSWWDYWQNYYSYILMYKLYGKNPGLFSNLHADNIFDMDGYIERIKNDPIDYYDDFYIETDDNGTPEDETDDTYTNHAPNLEADTSLIQNSYPGPEESELDSLSSQCIGVIEGAIREQLFKTVETQDGGPYSKRDMWFFIFGSDSGELNYEYWLNLFGNSGDVPETDPEPEPEQ